MSLHLEKANFCSVLYFCLSSLFLFLCQGHIFYFCTLVVWPFKIITKVKCTKNLKRINFQLCLKFCSCARIPSENLFLKNVHFIKGNQIIIFHVFNTPFYILYIKIDVSSLRAVQQQPDPEIRFS